MKTISLRLRQAKTELEEAGLETENMANSTAELRDVMLSVAGIDILEDDGETFRSTYDILDDLSKKWKELNEVERASLEKLIAGTRQGNVFNALMSNFDVARDALETSESSDGSAMAEHEKWSESLESKLNKLQNAWNNLSKAFLDDEFLGNLIDVGTGVLNVLTSITEAIGGFGVAIAGVGIAGFIKHFD